MRISGVPNAVERLDREGLKVIQTTAGKWKRTIDPFQAPTPEALAKAEEDSAEAFLNHNTSYIVYYLLHEYTRTIKLTAGIHVLDVWCLVFVSFRLCKDTIFLIHRAVVCHFHPGFARSRLHFKTSRMWTESTDSSLASSSRTVQTLTSRTKTKVFRSFHAVKSAHGGRSYSTFYGSVALGNRHLGEVTWKILQQKHPKR